MSRSSAAVRAQREEIPFDELERTAVLGEGGFGAVYLCQRRNKPGWAKKLREICVSFSFEVHFR